jgi:hypothetical protein
VAVAERPNATVCKTVKPSVRIRLATPNNIVMMIEVIYNNKSQEFEDLNQAMSWAKVLGEFVTIKINGMELVGRFGVDSIKDGVCPDGVKYDWNKANRIGRVKKERVE